MSCHNPPRSWDTFTIVGDLTTHSDSFLRLERSGDKQRKHFSSETRCSSLKVDAKNLPGDSDGTTDSSPLVIQTRDPSTVVHYHEDKEDTELEETE